MEYLDFELNIGAATADGYPVSIGGSPAGRMRLPLDDASLRQRLLDVEAEVARSSTVRRTVRAAPTGASPVETFGTELWKALMSQAVRESFRAKQTQARQAGKGLRLRLRIDDPTLASLPWEFLYDPETGDYVCLSQSTPLVRYVELPVPPNRISVQPPLSILAMVASPVDLPRLDVGREKRRIEEATSESARRGLLRITWLPEATWTALQDALRRDQFHIFHFVGHGDFDGKEGVLAFENEKGEKTLMRATDVGRLLEGHRTLQMAVLNSCLGARSSASNLFSSTAAVLARRDLPAVVAMQYEISDTAAIQFSRTLYASIADGMPIDAAVAEARKAISLCAERTVEWGTPVLHMRAPDGVLFTISPLASAAPPAPHAPAPSRGPEPSTDHAAERRTPRALVAGLAGLAVVAAVAAVLFFRPSGSGGPSQPTSANATPAAASAVATSGVVANGAAAADVPAAVADEVPRAPAANPRADPPVARPPVDIAMVPLPAGTFSMGAAGTRERPVHRVQVPAFEIGKYEVTVAQFQAYVDANPTVALDGCASYIRGWVTHAAASWKAPGFDQQADQPVVCVSYVDVKGFLAWLNTTGGGAYRLPSEAEWEYASRAGLTASRSWDNTEDTCDYAITAFWPAVCATKGLKRTASVGARKPNAFGLYDMLGNAAEWTDDWWNSDYQGAPTAGEAWTAGNRGFRVVRGGAWIHGLEQVRSEARDRYAPTFRSNTIGFRVARSMAGPSR